LRWSVPFLLLGAAAAAEHYGYVRSGKRPVPGATVTASMGDTKLVTTTDEKGIYVFDIPDKGKWTFQAEMFGFVTSREELNLVGAASVLDFDLELQAAAADTPAAAPAAAGFQTVDVKAQADADTQIDQQLEAASASNTSPMTTSAADANEAFLVNGSLSGGLQAVQQQNFFDQLDTSAGPAKKQKKAKSDLAPGEKRAKKAAKKAKKKKKAADTVSSFGATKQQSQIRGNVLYTLRDSTFDASPYSLSGLPVNKPSYSQNRFSVAAGGPLPGDSQTFFFVNFALLRSNNPYAGFDTVPTPAERSGDFSKPTSAGPVVLYDPISHLPVFGNIIPANRIDPIATGLLNYIPLPNVAGVGVMNYQYTTTIPYNSLDFSTKLDHNLNERNRFSLAFNIQQRHSQIAQLFGYQDKLDGLGWQSDIGYTHNFSPRTVNSFHWAFSRNRNDYIPFFSNTANVASTLGIQGTSPDPINYGPPNLSFTNFGSLNDGTPSIRRDQTTAWRDALTMVRRNHSLTVGGEYRRVQIDPITDTYGRGYFVFSGLLTSGFDSNLNRILPGTGFDFADFLYGFPNTAKTRFGSSANYFSSQATSAYFVDDWKVRSNLTLNLGLRHEYFQPFTEKYDRMSNLDLAYGVTGAAIVTPGQTGPYTGTFPRALVDSDPKNFSPRGSLAWRPFPKHHFVIRTGYSIFYNGSIYNDMPLHLASQPPFAQSINALTSIDYPLRLATGFIRASTKTINNSWVIDRNYKDGYAQTWNFSIEQTLTKSTSLELTYMGTKGTRLDILRAPNRALPGSPLTAEDRRLIGNAVGFTYETSDGNSVFHAGQARITRKLNKGLSFSALYTFAKSIDDVSALGGGTAVVAQDAGNLRGERGLSTFDLRQSLGMTFTAQSPIGKKTPLASPALTAILRSWALSGNITASTGLPFTARILGNLSDSGGSGNFGASRADATGLAVGAGTGYWNPAAFAAPSQGAFGDAGRDTIPGPNRFVVNLSFSRSFHATERNHIEFRIDATNLTNSSIFTNFGTVLNALNYGLPTVALPMRTFKATVRYKF
jgi:hypothetical protein